ncbi:MAG: dihydroneopterin aldolase [Bacteroidota bacterium]
MVKIELIGLEFFAYHGVYSQEQNGNNFIVDLSVEGDFEEAIDSDCLDGTVDYEKLYRIISEEMQVRSKLLEHVTGRIFKRIKEEYPEVKKIEVSVQKLNPPIKGNIKAAKVSISYPG